MNVDNEVLGVYALQNNIYYFLQSVFILKYQQGFKLVVIHNNRLIIEKFYPTIGGAKKAFYRYFKDRAWASNTRPIWNKDLPFFVKNIRRGGGM